MIIKINGTDINCTHEVKTNEHHHPAIHLTVEAEGVSLTHVLTIGSVDEPLPADYDATALQRDLDIFRQDKAEHLEGKIRGRKLADQVT